MNLADITTKSYILTMLIRDDGERFLLGDGAFEFKDSQQHFQPNTYANDVVELQGTDGQMLAGQVRRTATQTWNGYIGDATTSKQQVEQYRRSFFLFFRPRHYYTAVYIFCDGSAIQRKRGYIVNAPSVPELWQKFPEWSVGLNFEDPNYYEYAEDDEGNEIYAHAIAIALASAISGGLIWDGDGAVSDDLSYVGTEIQGEGKNFQLADTGTATLKSAELLGDATQTTYSGKNLLPMINTTRTINGVTFTPRADGSIALSGTASAQTSYPINVDSSNVSRNLTIPAGSYVVDDGIEIANIYVQAFYQETGGSVMYKAGSFTTTAEAVLGAYIRVNNGTNTNGTVIYPMLVSGSTPGAYEPYVGGTASPNPDYPQAVNTATGEQVVKVIDGDQKNLADPQIFVDWVNRTYGLCVLYNWGVDSNRPAVIEYNGRQNIMKFAASTLYSARDQMTNPTYDESRVIMTGNFKPATQYTISFDVPAGNQRNIVAFYSDGTSTLLNCGNTGADWAHYSETTPSGKTLVGLRTTYNTGITYIDLNTIQIEEGTTATAYTPFISQNKKINLGKNLLPISHSSSTATVSNISATSNDDGTITLNGTGNGNGWLEFVYAFKNGTTQQTTPTIKLDASATYTLSSTVLSGTITGAPIIMIQRDATGSATTANVGASIPFTGSDGVYRGFVRVASGQVFDNAKIGIQLELGSQATPYAPVFATKNMCYGTNIPASTQIYFNFDKSIITAGTYTISTVLNEATSNNTVSLLIDGTATNIGTFAGSAGSVVKTTFTLTNDQVANIRNSTTSLIRLYKSGANFTNPTWAQLELGSTATPYEPYGTPIELAKIGNYQDRIYKSAGKWYIEKQIGKVVLDGTENWASWGASLTNTFSAKLASISPAVKDAGSYGTGLLLSNYWTEQTNNALYNTDTQAIATTSNSFYVRINKSLLGSSDIAGLKTWLGTHNTTVYYALATPTDTEITNSELVGQLERLRHAHTYADTTNFSITATSPNLPAFLKVVAFGNDAIPQGGYVWEDGGSPRNIITIDGVDSALPIWKVNGPATNPTLTNITTGQTITWTGFVPSGQTLTIDMGEMTASLAGANVFEYVSGEWIELQSGNNLISYTAQGGATDPSTLEWNGVAG